MKNRKISKVLGAVVIMGLLSGCVKDVIAGIKGKNGVGKLAKNNKTSLVEFEYSYTGSINGESYSYRVNRQEDETVIFSMIKGYDDSNVLSMEADDQLLTDLKELYLKHRAAEWDGYNKSATHVLDGDGFSVYMTFEDGQRISFHGYNCAPDGYNEYEKEMIPLFQPYEKTVLENDRQSKIAEGIHGTLDFFLVNFIQQGSSGKSFYKFFVRSEDGSDRMNFDVNIQAKDEEFIEKGNYSYYSRLDNIHIGFEDFQALIEKYEIINWYDYDETADDYNNQEWFQVDFGFTEGNDIQAMGTLHPENYDDFRREFIQLMIEKILTAEKEGILNQRS